MNESAIPTPATPDVCTFAVLVEGAEIAGEVHILAIVVTRELNRIPTATLQLRDGEASQATFALSNTDQFIPGKEIEIQLGYRAQNETVFKGIIVKHSVKLRKNGSLLTVECRDEAVKMTQGAKSRYFIDTTDSAVMEEIIDSYGLQKQVEATTPELPEIVQYDASDWDFLLCRAEANAQIVMVQDGKITVAQPATGTEPLVNVRFGASLLELDAEIDARWQSQGIKATSWNAADQELLEVQAAEPDSALGGNLTASDLAAVLDDEEHQIRHGGGLAEPELQTWADARLLKERLAKVRGRARLQGLATVLPGKIIEVTGIGERFEGKMYVCGIRHSVSNGNWETDVQFGLSTELFAETYNLRPLLAGGLLPAAAGLQLAVVTALANDPAGEDRVKIRMPLVSSDGEGSWARVATLDAGKERGTFFRPAIGDEVVVGFLSDDPRHPVVLGMCHSSANPAPEPAADDNHRKGYVSREKMQFVFDDEKKSIVLETPAGNRLTLSEDSSSIVVEDQNGNTITLDSAGISIESSADLTLKASGNIRIEGINVDASAQSAFKAVGNASAEVSAASTTLKGSATTVIQGGLVQIN